MGVDDFQRYDQRLRKAIRRIEESDDIAEVDREALLRFVDERQHDLAKSSLEQYLTKYRVTAERFDTPLVEMDYDDVMAVWRAYRTDPQYGQGDGTMADASLRNYQATLRIFWTWLGREWADDLDRVDADTRVEATDMLAPVDIAALTQAADNLRDIALIEFLADTGARISMVGSLRVQDVDLDSDRATYTPNPNATGLKGASIKPYPIVDARASLRTYLNQTHPRPDTPGVALFHKLRDYEGTDGAMSPRQLDRRLNVTADRTGVGKPVNPHNFRHSAISRMYREGYKKHEIQHRVAWDVDTNMWDRYVHLEAEDVNNSIFASAGIGDGDDEESPERHPCGNCRAILAPHHEYCPNCGEPATPEARRVQDEAEDEGIGLLASSDLTPRERRVVEMTLSAVRSDREVRPAHDSASQD